MTGEASARPRKKASRPRHVPQRTCVACRQKDAKREYIRIVRTPEQVVEIDRTGKANGRGAYLCARRGCWDTALETGALARALKISIDPETRAKLAEFSRSHFPPDDDTF